MDKEENNACGGAGEAAYHDMTGNEHDEDGFSSEINLEMADTICKFVDILLQKWGLDDSIITFDRESIRLCTGQAVAAARAMAHDQAKSHAEATVEDQATEEYTPNSLATTKYAACLCHAFYTACPVQWSDPENDPVRNHELTVKLNIRLGLQISFDILTFFRESGLGNEDIVIGHPCGSCLQCIERYIRLFFGFIDNYNYLYLKHIMSHRHTNEYSLTAMFDHIIFASCQSAREGKRDRRLPKPPA